jgi:hypothetical protein
MEVIITAIFQVRPYLHTEGPWEGALTSLFAATNPAVWMEKDKYGGAYLMPFDVIEESSENARNPELAKQLWATSEQVTNDVLAE